MDNVADFPFALLSHESCPECHKPICYKWSKGNGDFRVGRCPHCEYPLAIVALPYHVCGRMGPVPLRASTSSTIGVDKTAAEASGVYISIEKDDRSRLKADKKLKEDEQ